LRLAAEVEAARVTRAEEELAVGRQVDRAAEVRALGRERDHRGLRPFLLSNQPDRADRLSRVLDPGVLPLLDDRERLGDTDLELAEVRQRLEGAVGPLFLEKRV